MFLCTHNNLVGSGFDFCHFRACEGRASGATVRMKWKWLSCSGEGEKRQESKPRFPTVSLHWKGFGAVIMKQEVEGASVAISDKFPRAKAPHIKKRALRNKALSITFNEKDLKDYVTGFHKRKKKRRKEAQRNIQEKERLKRIGARKKRKLERESALYGGVQPSSDIGSGETGDDNEREEESELTASVSGTKLYDNGDLKIIVKTSEIEDDEGLREKTQGIPRTSTETEKKHNNIPVQKKTFKASQHKTMRKPQKKRNDKKGKKKKN
ncbi:hypothetical protein NE237_024917 [Protea cynaroides]|uniref:Ribosomal RNA-processing protein 17 n=1 Tax=Protea cynaroides TaxID=273540 RepID=A0A9Q0H361_9MAGN|nr:hypothetical protein NE237_024917 [Protea cynaroides]